MQLLACRPSFLVNAHRRLIQYTYTVYNYCKSHALVKITCVLPAYIVCFLDYFFRFSIFQLVQTLA